jgi:GTPase SAR1 family protein
MSVSKNSVNQYPAKSDENAQINYAKIVVLGDKGVGKTAVINVRIIIL